MVTLNRASPVPLYYQLGQHFVELVHSAKLAPGDKLPPEEITADEFGVSRYTVRQAFQSLERQGYAEQIRGKGFFVKEPRIPLSIAWLLVGFYEHMRGEGHSVDTEIVSQGVIDCPHSTAERLEIPTNSPVVFTKRLRRVDGHPLTFDNISIPASLAEGIERIDLGQRSLLQVLKDEFGLEVVRESREMRINMPQSSVTELFQLPRRTPVFVTEGVGTSADQTPIYYCSTYINETKCHFTFDMILDGDLSFAPDTSTETVRVQRNSVNPKLRT